ncbi:hypothetical protein [Alienimonas chondri]|uniref:hypothetical protein n=1 Tax=Alienimonas chondri TaxID=2681879 RepID=UPI00148775AE|nr:hypothetical protein [Alienimonas chondri]
MADSSVRSAPETGPRSGSENASASASGTSRDVACPSCGENVRPGLVRCWSCGGFMRADVADRFAEMDQRRPEVQYQPLPELDASGAAKLDAERTGPRRTSEDDADFEFAGEFVEAEEPASPDAGADEFTMDDIGDGSFSAPLLGSSTEIPAAGQAAGAEAAKPAEDKDGETYGVAGADEEPASAAEGDSSTAPAAEKPPASRGADESDVAHSDATGGDVLLDIALQEAGMNRGGRRRGLRVQGDKILLHCPAGHPVKVGRKHAGKVGRCPHPGCGLRYLVPDIPPDPEEEAAADPGTAEAAEGAGRTAGSARRRGVHAVHRRRSPALGRAGESEAEGRFAGQSLRGSRPRPLPGHAAGRDGRG